MEHGDVKDRLDLLEGRVDELMTAVAGLEARLRRLEGPREPSATAVAAGRPDAEAAAADSAAPPPAVDAGSVAGVLPVLGRAFLVLCGAFLLRSLTEAGILPQAVGIVLGYLYAALWIVLADRAARAGRALAATLSGGVASIIAYPLLWEATRRFALLSADQAVAGLALFTALALAVAWRRRLRSLAVVVTIAALATDLVLMVASRSWGPTSVVALALAAVSIWCGYLRGWPGLRWPVALAVDVLPVMMISDAIRGLEPGVPAGPPTATVLLVATGFIVVYLGSFALAMLGMRRRVGTFEVVQGIVVLAAGFAATHHLLNALAMDDRLFGALTLIAGLVCYGTAFMFVDRRFGRGGNFFYFSSLALMLSIGGVATATEGAMRVAVLCVFGLAAAIVGARFNRITLRSHSAVFIVVAAVIGGTAGRTIAAFTMPPAGVTHPPPVADLLVVGAAIACSLALSAAGSRPAGPWPKRVPDLVIAAISVAGIGALGLMIFTRLVERAGAVDPSLLAAARTVVLSLGAVVIAALGSLRNDPVLRRLVHPLLVVCGLKLIAEDLRHGRPAMLFVAFAVFGTALIVAPRLLRSAAVQDDGTPET